MGEPTAARRGWLFAALAGAIVVVVGLVVVDLVGPRLRPGVNGVDRLVAGGLYGPVAGGRDSG